MAYHLSPRETEVGGLYYHGMSAKQIASKLNLSEKTIWSTLARVKEKTWQPTPRAAVEQAFRDGHLT